MKLVLSSDIPRNLPLPEEETVVEYILKKCGENSKNEYPCIENPITGEAIEYAEIKPMVQKAEGFLLENGFKKGDIVISMSHEGSKLHVFFMGIWRAGGIVQCLYPDDAGDALAAQVFENQPKFILCDVEQSEACVAAGAAGGNTRVLTFEPAENCLSLADIFKRPVVHCDSVRLCAVEPTRREDVALLLPTSGTTGSSKWVIYTHETLLRNVIFFESFPFTDDPTAPSLLTGKQTHFTGSVCPLAFFAGGRRLLMMREVSRANILYTVDKYRVKSIFSFPSLLTGMVDEAGEDQDLKSIEFVFTAGLVLGPNFFETVRKLPNVKSIVTIYGMTEVGFLTANVEWSQGGRSGPFSARLGRSIVNGGRLQPGASLRVMDIDTGKPVGAGQKGELSFHSDLICKGYWKNSEATEETFRDKWIHTGDLGYYDEQGNIYVLNRIKEVFKYYNNHITPSEIENLIILQCPQVTQVCVVGISDPDGGGFIPRAYVKLREGSDSSGVAMGILEDINAKMPDYKKLRGGVFIVESFPMGKTGKILRNLLLDGFDENLAIASSRTPSSD